MQAPINKSFSYFLSDRDLAVAELTLILNTEILLEDLGLPLLEEPWYFFNRIKVPDRLQGQGYGTILLKEVVEWADACKVNIYCPLNPYGLLDLKSLIHFYRKQGFTMCEGRETEMFRLYN